MKYCSTEKEIRYSLERYLDITRGKGGKPIFLSKEIVLDALNDLNYDIVKMKDGEMYFNLDSRSIEKFALVRKPRVYGNELCQISDSDKFIEDYGAALKDLIEGSETNKVYTNKHGMYTLFNYDNKTFKVQFLNGYYLAELFKPEEITK
jgi:hypothetical protein